MQELEKNYGWTFTPEEYQNTPKRIESMLSEWKEKNTYSKMTTFDNTEKYDELIVIRDIEFTAFCSHHLLPFHGTISVAYLPRDKILGASKIVRIAEKFAYKAQVQEKLTVEIANEIMNVVNPVAVVVIVKAQHFCMIARGVKKENSEMVTSAVRGEAISNASLKAEALKLLGE
ncbi:MAG: GTP cyclohydrolase I FolE [Candidatus Parvarchaeum sp.]